MTYVYPIKIDTEIDEKEDKQNLRACLLQRLAFVLLATDLRPCCSHSPEAHDTVFYLRLNYGMLINVKINKTSHRVNIHKLLKPFYMLLWTRDGMQLQLDITPGNEITWTLLQTTTGLDNK